MKTKIIVMGMGMLCAGLLPGCSKPPVEINLYPDSCQETIKNYSSFKVANINASIVNNSGVKLRLEGDIGPDSNRTYFRFVKGTLKPEDRFTFVVTTKDLHTSVTCAEMKEYLRSSSLVFKGNKKCFIKGERCEDAIAIQVL